MYGASRDFVYHAKRSGVVPRDWRFRDSTFARDFPGARRREFTTLDQGNSAGAPEIPEDAAQPGEHIAQTRKIACSAFGQDHSAGAAARARADAPRLENHHGFFRGMK